MGPAPHKGALVMFTGLQRLAAASGPAIPPLGICATGKLVQVQMACTQTTQRL